MSSLFDVRKQLAFYGAYHSHPVNVLIHIFGVPAILWSAFVLSTQLPPPAFLPPIKYVFNESFVFETNAPALMAVFYIIYYFILDPVAAFLYTPHMVLTLLTATAYAHRPDGIRIAIIVHVTSWVAQFIGHGFMEGRAPALFDNILGAIVLAPFFVHLELLFAVGYRPELRKQLKNDVGIEIARIRREKAEKHRSEKKTS
ncbi:hypothetical protein M404DRAFT_19747 [Pisolithus tinctorius Marx 270]|uniref:DUF962-domain-containing protein n=1 Tax=Pisolithus tinctorius Marx 270 TaxID=870435 RepID=A0A0C3PGJ3_PISTI|nr:hypothetical protein M404DRAFT_19747 [Pisolithus tinctorius Marx 270]